MKTRKEYISIFFLSLFIGATVLAEYCGTGSSGIASLPDTGTVKALMILAKFHDDDSTDTPYTEYWPPGATSTPSWAQDLLSPSVQSNYSHPSVSGFFHEMSNGKMDFIGDVYPSIYISEHSKYWYKDSQGRHISHFTEEILINLDSQIDYSEYDGNGDNVVDMIIIVVRWLDGSQRKFGDYESSLNYQGIASLSGAEGTFQESGVSSLFTGDGVSIEAGSSGSGVLVTGVWDRHHMRVILHEVGHHWLGGGHGGTYSDPNPERWGLVTIGKSGCMSAAEREELDWIDIVDVTSKNEYLIEDTHSIDNTGKAYKIPISGSSDYYYIENRGEGYYSSTWKDWHHQYSPYMPSTGLIIMKGDDWKDVRVITADNNFSGYGDAGDPYKIGGNELFAPSTTPSSDYTYVELLDEFSGDINVKFIPNYWGGTITQNTIWGGEVYLYSDLTVNSGVTLTIESNTVIKAANNVSLTVHGTLEAAGTLSQPITFTGDDAIQANFPDASWDGIRFIDGASNSTLDYCDISYALDAVYVDNTDLTISNSYFHDNYYAVDAQSGAEVRMRDNTLRHQDTYALDCGPNAHLQLVYDDGDAGGNRLENNNNGMRATGYGYIDMGDVDGSDYYDWTDNSVLNTTGYDAFAYYYGTVMAEDVWWGSLNPTPQSYTYYGVFDYQPFRTSNPGGGSGLAKSRKRTSPTPSTPPVVDQTDPASLYEAGRYYRLVKQPEEAKELFRTVVNRFPTSTCAPKALTQLYHITPETDWQTLDTYLQHFAGSKTAVPVVRRQAQLLRTYLAFRHGDRATGAHRARQIVRNHPGTWEELASLYVLALRPSATDARIDKAWMDTMKARYPEALLTYKARAMAGESIDWVQTEAGLGKTTLPDVSRPSSGDLPDDFVLHQAYPNPFNPMTTIRYDLPEPSDVILRIYSIRGILVRLLHNGYRPAGYHAVVWDGRDEYGQRVPSGVYFSMLTAGARSHTRKMLLVK